MGLPKHNQPIIHNSLWNQPCDEWIVYAAFLINALVC